MPSIDVKSDDRTNLSQRVCADSPRIVATPHSGETQPEITKKMPCSPYEKCGVTFPEALPPDRKCEDPPPEKNGTSKAQVHSQSAENTLADEMAEKQHQDSVDTPPELPREPKKVKAKVVDEEETSMIGSKSKKPKPLSWSLLEMTYKDQGGRGRGQLVRQKSLKTSFEKATHVLAHALSAPAALSDALEPVPEDEVFKEDEGKTSKCQQPGEGDSSPVGPSSIKSSEESLDNEKAEPLQKDPGSDSETRDGDEIRENKIQKIVEKEGSGEGQAEESCSNEVAREVVTEQEEEKDRESSEEKPKVKEDDEDIGELVEGMRKGLTLDASSGKEEKKATPVSEEISALADDLNRGMRLNEKTERKPAIQTSVASRVSSTEQGPTRLRAKGIHKPEDGRQPGVIMSTNNAFAHQPAWMQCQQPQQQNQPLPPIQVFQQPPMRMNTYGQPTQSVVSPPGQGNHACMVFIDRPMRSQMLKIGPTGQSKQIQYAQQNLCLENSQQQRQQNYMLNSMTSVRSSVQMNQQQPMNIPEQSTGTPSEVDWPPTPESDRSDVDNLLEIISDDEMIRSPVESGDQLMSMHNGSFLDLASVPSPQSPWGDASITSISPVPSPYADPQQASSPFHKVPDVTSPLSPESNLGSPGMPPSPEGSFIHVRGTMSVLSNSRGYPPNKRKRNDSTISTDSQEAKEAMNRIKNFLKEEPDASPPHGLSSYWQNSPQELQYPLVCTPPYAPATSPVPVAAQPPPAPMYAQSEPSPEGELDAYRKHLSRWSVDDLLDPDDDRDTVLHLAICQMKEPLSLAIIERICFCNEKHRLNCTNNLQQTSLFLSVVSNLPILTQILINYGADPTLGNKQLNTPLHMAAMYGSHESIKAILDGLTYYGYSEEYAHDLFNNRNIDGKTPLMLAVENHGNQNLDRKIINCTETIQLLLRTYASSLVQDSKSGKTALHYAVELRKINLILVLLEYCDDAGKLVNSQMYDGNTALHLIVGRSLPETEILNIVNLLMNRGANVGIDNAAKEKPLDLVLREHLEIKRRLHGQGNRKR